MGDKSEKDGTTSNGRGAKDGRGERGGDQGGGREQDKVFSSGNIGCQFVFGSGSGARVPERGESAKDGGMIPNRRSVPPSFKDKLLSLCCSGYLMKHDEEDDIVNGWKAYFKKLSELEVGRAIVNEESENEGNDGRKGKRPELKVSAEQYAAWCKPWLNSLNVKVLGTEIPCHILQPRIERMWRPQGSMKFMPLNN